jgi:hypothetical protein
LAVSPAWPAEPVGVAQPAKRGRQAEDPSSDDWLVSDGGVGPDRVVATAPAHDDLASFLNSRLEAPERGLFAPGLPVDRVAHRLLEFVAVASRRMAVTIYQRLVRLFPPTWQRHRQMNASTSVSIIECFQRMVLIGVNRDGKARLGLDVSLLQ